MKSLLSQLALGLTLSVVTALDMENAEPTKQQTKMAACNKNAGDKKGDERKAFMNECLSAK